jgi:hypothetical protein
LVRSGRGGADRIAVEEEARGCDDRWVPSSARSGKVIQAELAATMRISRGGTDRIEDDEGTAATQRAQKSGGDGTLATRNPSNGCKWLGGGTVVTPHVSKPHDYVNHMFMRP